MNEHPIDIHASIDGTRLEGVLRPDDEAGRRLEIATEPRVSVRVLDPGADLEAHLRDLHRLACAIADNRALLERLEAEDAGPVKAARAEAERLFREVDHFVPPPTGWAHAMARHQNMTAVRRALRAGVRAAEAAKEAAMASRIAELVGNLEVLDPRTLRSVRWT